MDQFQDRILEPGYCLICDVAAGANTRWLCAMHADMKVTDFIQSDTAMYAVAGWTLHEHGFWDEENEEPTPEGWVALYDMRNAAMEHDLQGLAKITGDAVEMLALMPFLEMLEGVPIDVGLDHEGHEWALDRLQTEFQGEVALINGKRRMRSLYRMSLN